MNDKKKIEELVGEDMEDMGLSDYFDEDGTYNGDDPRCDEENVARHRENWGGKWGK